MGSGMLDPMRVYLGTTLSGLAEAVKQGGFGPGPLGAHAVTPRLREWYVEGDIEELEYAALSEAARASLRLLAVDESSPRRRVVVAAEVDDSDVRQAQEGARSQATVARAIAIQQIQAVHVDEEDAADTVDKAARAIGKADEGDEDAEFAVDEAEGFELLWYARQEIPDLLH